MSNKSRRRFQTALSFASRRGSRRQGALANRNHHTFEQLEARRVFAAFTAGDIAVLRVGTGSAVPTNASTADFIDEYNPANGHLVQSIALPTADSGLQHALTNSGTASSEGELNLSTNGQYLLLTGYDTAPGMASVSGTTSAAVPRTVGEVGPGGSVDTTTALTDFASANNPRGATSTDGANIWLAGADASTGGIRYISGLGGSTSTDLTGTTLKNARDVEIVNGQVYFASAKTPQIISALGTGLPTTGPATITGLSGTDLAAGSASAPNSFFFARLGAGASFNGFDTLYVADSSATSTGANPGITKYSYDGFSWSSDGSIGTTSAFEGLTGSVSGGAVQLYATTPTGIFSIVDNSGYAGALTAAVSPVATAATNEAFRGVAFVPQVPAIHFVVSASPSSVAAGDSFNVTVTAEDSSNAVVHSYMGTVHFSTSDSNPSVVIPGDYMFTGTDSGVHTFNNVSLVTAGSQTVTATDTSSFAIGSTAVMVAPTGFQQLIVTAPPDSTAGTPFSITVTAEDQYGNTVTGYTGTVTFTKSDSGAGSAVPGPYMFVGADNGVHTFTNSVTLTTAGNQTITATDHSITGSAIVENFVIAPFTPGDLVVYRVGIGGSTVLAGGAAPVFLDEYNPAGTLVQSIPMPVVSTIGGNQALVSSGTASSEGQLNLSPNGTYLTLTGYDAALGTASVSSTKSAATPRTVAVVNGSGTINSTTALTDFSSGSNIRSSITTDGTSLWVTGGKGGIGYTTLGSTTSTAIVDPAGEQNLRDIAIVDGQLYVSSQKTLRLGTVGTGLPTTAGQTLTNLPPSVPDNGSNETPNGFFLAHVSSSGTGVDTLYLTDDTAGEIEKFSLNSGSWNLDGTIAAPGIRGLTGVVNGSTVTLYGTTSGANGDSGTLYKYVDSSGFGGFVSDTATTIATAPANEGFRGVAFVPAVTDVAPTVALNGSSGTFTVKGIAGSDTPVLIASLATVSDSDSPLLAFVTVTLPAHATGDALAVSSGGLAGGMTAVYTSANGTLTISGAFSPAQYTTALQHVTYSNTTSLGPGVTSETYTVVANDGLLSSTPVNGTVNIDISITNNLLFYNGSTGFDTTGHAWTPNAFSDDNAVAIDKTAYVSGAGTATFASVSSYFDGINGLMIDIAGAHNTIVPGDFILRTGNNNTPSLWTTIPTASITVTTRSGATGSSHTAGTDRIEITMANLLVKNKWLEVIFKGTDRGDANTLLATSDVFFYASSIGDDGIADGSVAFIVDPSDVLGARANQKGLINNIPITNIYDYDRSHTVDPGDVLIARSNQDGSISAPKLLNITGSLAPDTSGGASAAVAGGGGISSGLADSASASTAPTVPTWLANRLANVDLNSGRIATFFEDLAAKDTPKARKILIAADELADSLGLDDDLLDSLVAGLGQG